jgi:hypothetical protein
MNDRTPVTRVQDAINYHYFRTRLDDPGLLDRAVITEEGYLAVPAGGKRLGGFVTIRPKAAGNRLVRQLAARPDEFPDARLVRGDPWDVEWGPELDWNAGHVIIGRYLGYSEAAIAGYERMQVIHAIARQAGARVWNEMNSFEDACSFGTDVDGAIRLLDEAISDYYDVVLRGTAAVLQDELAAAEAMRDLEDGAQ